MRKDKAKTNKSDSLYEDDIFGIEEFLSSGFLKPHSSPVKLPPAALGASPSKAPVVSSHQSPLAPKSPTVTFTPNKTKFSTPGGTVYQQEGDKLGEGSFGSALVFKRLAFNSPSGPKPESYVVKQERGLNSGLGRAPFQDHSPMKKEAKTASLVHGKAFFVCDSTHGGECTAEIPHRIIYPKVEGAPLDDFFLDYIDNSTLAEAALMGERVIKRLTEKVSEFHGEVKKVHCDLKPDNIIVNYESKSDELTLTLIDLGSATAVGSIPRDGTVNLSHYPKEFIGDWGNYSAAKYAYDFAAVGKIGEDLEVMVENKKRQEEKNSVVRSKRKLEAQFEPESNKAIKTSAVSSKRSSLFDDRSNKLTEILEDEVEERTVATP